MCRADVPNSTLALIWREDRRCKTSSAAVLILLASASLDDPARDKHCLTYPFPGEGVWDCVRVHCTTMHTCSPTLIVFVALYMCIGGRSDAQRH